MYNVAGHASNIHASNRSLQNTNTPDIDLDRDLIDPDLEILLGMETGELASEKQSGNRLVDKKFQVNITTIIISALIFLSILAWFDFIQSTIFNWLAPQNDDPIPSSVKLWYAIFVTVFIIILIILIYYHSQNYLK